jgi:hypothetical protein
MPGQLPDDMLAIPQRQHDVWTSERGSFSEGRSGVAAFGVLNRYGSPGSHEGTTFPRNDTASAREQLLLDLELDRKLVICRC